MQEGEDAREEDEEGGEADESLEGPEVAERERGVLQGGGEGRGLMDGDVLHRPEEGRVEPGIEENDEEEGFAEGEADGTRFQAGKACCEDAEGGEGEEEAGDDVGLEDAGRADDEEGPGAVLAAAHDEDEGTEGEGEECHGGELAEAGARVGDGEAVEGAEVEDGGDGAGARGAQELREGEEGECSCEEVDEDAIEVGGNLDGEARETQQGREVEEEVGVEEPDGVPITVHLEGMDAHGEIATRESLCDAFDACEVEVGVEPEDGMGAEEGEGGEECGEEDECEIFFHRGGTPFQVFI